MPIIAPCSSSPSLDGRGRARARAMLCIVIRESPLSPFLPIFKCRDLQLYFLFSVAHRPPSLTFFGLPYSPFPPSRHEMSIIAKYR